MRESRLEKRCCSMLEKASMMTMKAGHQGWPDRLVIIRPGHHVWLEFKVGANGLTPAQKIRIPQLMEKGETVYIIREVSDLLAVLVFL